MVRFIGCILATLWVMTAGFTVAQAEDKRPKAVVFVVGVLNYQGSADSELNQLKYTAKDAEDVFKQLAAVTDMDKTRSRLLLAVRDENTDPASSGPGYLVRSRYLDEARITREFKDFLKRLNHEDNVIIYFGGHGIPEGKKDLWFLPSDYGVDKNRYLRFSQIQNELKRAIDRTTGNELLNVKVTMLVNMCGAGTAGVMSAQTDPGYADIWKETHRQFVGGFKKYALIPASAPGANTFEKEKYGRSIMVHHLLKGLRGGEAAEDGLIKSGKLFKVIRDGINSEPDGGEIPRIPGFDDNIIIGATGRLEAVGSYLLGNSVLAVARDYPDISYFQEFAEQYFKLVPQLGDKDLSALAKLRLTQIHGYFGGQPKQLAKALKNLRGFSVSRNLKGSAHKNAEALLASGDPSKTARPSKFATLGDFRDYLASGKSFVTLQLCKQLFGCNRSDGALWQRVLTSYGGQQGLEEYSPKKHNVEITIDQITPSLDKLRNQALAYSNSTTNGSIILPLIVIYNGDSETVDDNIVPFGKNTIQGIDQYWHGPIIVIVTASFSGSLLDKHGRLPNNGNLYLFTSGIDKNSLSFLPAITDSKLPIGRLLNSYSKNKNSVGFGSTSFLMAQLLFRNFNALEKSLLLDNYKNNVKNNVDLYNNFAGRRQKFVLSEPVWLNSTQLTDGTSADAQVELLAINQLQPLDRWTSLLAGGCGHGPVADCKKAILKVSGVEPFDELNKAVAADISGRNIVTARIHYNKFLSGISEIGSAPHDTHSEFARELQNGVRRQLENLARRVERRVAGVEGKSVVTGGGGEIRIIGVAVDNYLSPLVPGLANPIADLEKTAQLIKSHFAETSTSSGRAVEIAPFSHNPETADEIRAYLEQQLGNVGPNGLVVFLYSGRGYSRSGQRFISASGATLSPSGGTLSANRDTLMAGLVARIKTLSQTLSIHPTQGQVPPGWDNTHLLPLSELARTADGKWLLGIYDTQFDAPILDEDRPDQINDKHLDSVRPKGQINRAREPDRKFRGEPATGRIPDNQIHIFWDGTLTEPSQSMVDCTANAKLPQSPLLTTIFSSIELGEAETYQQLGERVNAHPCLRNSSADGRLVIQGALHLPPFASGNAAEQLVFFRNGFEQKMLTLNTAKAVATIVKEPFPTPLNRLTKLALKTKFAVEQFKLPAKQRSPLLAGPGDRKRWLQDLLDGLERLDGITSTDVDNEPRFKEIVLDLKTQVMTLSNDIDTARGLLLEALEKGTIGPDLAGRLISLTRLSLDKKPGELLKQMAPVFNDAIETKHRSMDAVVSGKWRTLNALIETRSGPYVIDVNSLGSAVK